MSDPLEHSRRWVIPAGAVSGADALRLEPVPAGTPGPGEVRVAMRAWSLNFRDLMIATGRYPGGAVARDTVPLSDGAGEIVAIGPGVQRWQPGDRVVTTFFQGWQSGPIHSGVPRTALGGAIDGVLAEQAILSADGLVRVPEPLSFEEAACLPCAGLTAWSALFDAASLQTGQTVLVLGTGGVSVFALQFAKAAGARVIATSSSDDRLARARSLGADETINYRSTPEWDTEVLARTAGHGVDIVVEVGGAGTLPRSMNAVALGGTVAVIGVLAGGGAIDPSPLIPKAIRLQGLYVGHRAGFEAMNAAIIQSGLRPVISDRFTFGDAPDAWRAMARGGHFGKIVVVMP